MLSLRERGLPEKGPWPFHLPRMRVRGFGAGRHTVSGHAQTLRLVVSGDVVCGEPENGVSALGLAKALGLGSYHTAWEWLHKLRRAKFRPGRDRSPASSKSTRLSLAASAGAAGVEPKASP